MHIAFYNSFGYWYDALDAYNQWLEANPQDSVATSERRDMLAEGFKDIPKKLRVEQPGSELLNLENLLHQLEVAQFTQIEMRSP